MSKKTAPKKLIQKLKRNPVMPGLVSPKRYVPPNIKRPPYALNGNPGSPVEPLVRTSQELEAMRKTGAMAAEVLLRAAEKIQPGVTTDSVDVFVHDEIISHNAYPSPLNYKSFPKSVCTSVNEVICHGIPDSRKLVEGDIINVDVTVYKDGVHGDTSATFFVGEPPGEAVVSLVFETCKALYLGIDAVKVGNVVSDIGKAIETHANQQNLQVVTEFIGHGIGTEFHSALAIPHFFDPNHNLEFVPGMTFTIEPMFNLGSPSAKILSDQWTAITLDRSYSAQFEHTLAVTDDGAEILTLTAAGECAHSHHQAIPLTSSPAAANKL